MDFKTFLKRAGCVIAALAMIVVGTATITLRLHDDPDARAFSDDESGKSMFLQNVDLRLIVPRSGDLLVEEVLTYDLGSVAWRGLYQDVILANNERARAVSVSRIDDGLERQLGSGSGIVLGKGGDYGTFGYGVVDDDGLRKLRIVWNVNDTGVVSFIVRYRLGGAVKNYRDASALLWDVWGTGWETGVQQLSASVEFPGRIKRFFPRAGELQERISGRQVKGNEGSFNVTNIPQKRQVQVQVAAAPIAALPVQNSDILPKIDAEQAEIVEFNDAQARRSEELDDKPLWWFLVPAMLAALVGLFAVWLIYLGWGRDRTKMIEAGGSYQYPPEKIPAPVVAKALGTSDQDNLVSSVLIAFLQRDVFRILPSVERKEDISIRNNVGESTFDRTKVAAYELPIAELLQTAIDDHPEKSPDFSKLKKHITATTAESKLSEFDKALKAQFPTYNIRSTYRGRVRRWVVGILALLLYALGLIAALGTDGGNMAARWDDAKWGLWLVGFAPVILWAAVEGNAFYRLKADQAERVRAWETYQDFFAKMDMSREYPLTIEIWDEALAYGAAFGYARKVITNMPRVTQTGAPAPFPSGTGLGLVAANSASLGAFSSLSSGVSGVTGMSSSSSSGGGGFSGGGSGGGGGGGW